MYIPPELVILIFEFTAHINYGKMLNELVTNFSPIKNIYDEDLHDFPAYTWYMWSERDGTFTGIKKNRILHCIETGQHYNGLRPYKFPSIEKRSWKPRDVPWFPEDYNTKFYMWYIVLRELKNHKYFKK